MEVLQELLDLYQKLCSHCDALFASACSRLPGSILCSPGCDLCCTIQSVTMLEAFVIERHITAHRPLPQGSDPAACIFLSNGLCSIYPVRPVICRTHGLLLYNSDSQEIRKSCKMNFRNLPPGSNRSICAVDEVNITENLIRLNLAFIKLTEADYTGDGRMRLTELAGKIPDPS